MSSTNSGPAQTQTQNMQPLAGTFNADGTPAAVVGPGGVVVTRPFDPSSVAITGGVIGGASVGALALTAGRSVRSPGPGVATTLNGSGFWFVGSDLANGVTFFRSGSNIFISTDRGTTMSSGKGLPTGVTDGFSVAKMVPCFGLWWVVAIDSGDSLYKVWSCPVVTGNGALTWTLRHTLAVGTTGRIAGCINPSADGLTLCVSEYSTSVSVPPTTGGPSIYRCTNGTTFTKALQIDAVRHWHGVWEDAYAAGTWYALLGDGTTTPLYRSTDSGATWSAVPSVGQGWDGVAMTFSPKYIWITGDVYNGQTPVAPVYVLDRATMTPQVGCVGIIKNVPVMNPGMFSGGTVTSGSATMTMQLTQQLYATTEDIGRRIIVKDSAGTVLFNGTISNVSGPTITLSGTASATTASNAAYYTIDRNERYYPLALQGAVDPVNEVFYMHSDNTAAEVSGLAYRYGLFCVPKLFGPLVLLDNMPTNTPHVAVVNGYVMTGASSRPVITMGSSL